MNVDFKKTALIVIDLQKGVLAMPCVPHSAQVVVENSAKLMEAFQKEGSFIAVVHVPRPDESSLNPILDDSEGASPADFPLDWDEIVPEIQKYDSHHIVQKRQWGAFYGTDLDAQLRRRGIDTLILCGVSTAYGVDTTAREAFQHGYHQIFAIDAMAGFTEEEHEYVKSFIFPKIGRIRTTNELLALTEK